VLFNANTNEVWGCERLMSVIRLRGALRVMVVMERSVVYAKVVHINLEIEGSGRPSWGLVLFFIPCKRK
jgi:acetolactate synthase regulatory subunit